MTVELIVNATIPEGTSANATVFEDTDQDGTADNSENATLQDGERVYELTSLEGGTGNDYWIEYQLNSDPEEPSPTINDSLIESEPPDAIVEAEIDANVPLSMTVTATVFEDRNLDGTATNSESFNVEDGFNYYRLNTLDGGTADYWIEYTFEGPETSNAEIVSSTVDNDVEDLNVTADVTASVPAGTSATLIFYEDRNQDGVADNTQEVSLSDGTQRYNLTNFVGGTGNDYWVDRELQSDGDETTPEVSEITINTDTKSVEITTTATVPTNTSLDITVYEDQDADGTADGTGTVAIADGAGTTQGIGELGGGSDNQYWIEREYQTTDTTQSPELGATTLDTNATATTVENTVSDNAVITQSTATTLTSTESATETVADSANITSAIATPLTSTEATTALQDASDNANVTAVSATPLESKETIEQIGGTDLDLFEDSAIRYTQDVTKDSGDNWPITIEQTLRICVDNLNQVEEVEISSFTDGCAVTQTINDITDDDKNGCVVVDASFELECTDDADDTVQLTTFGTVTNGSKTKSTFISDTSSSATTDSTTGTNTTVGSATIETGNKITEVQSNTVTTTSSPSSGTVSTVDKTNRTYSSQVAGEITNYSSLPLEFSQQYVLTVSEVEMLQSVNVLGQSNKTISVDLTGFSTDTSTNEVTVNVDITISGENDGDAITYKVLIDLVYGAKRTKVPGGGTNVGRGAKIIPAATTSKSRFVPSRTRQDVLENLIDSTTLPPVSATSNFTQYQADSKKTGVTSDDGPTAGTQAWSSSLDNLAEIALANDDSVYAVSDEVVQSYDITTGTQNWTDTVVTTTVNDPPVLEGDKLYILGFNDSNETVILRYDVNLQTTDWSTVAYTSGGIASSPLVDSGSVYFVEDAGGPSSIYSFDASNGSENWSAEVANGNDPDTSGISALALDTDNSRLVFSDNSGMYAYDPTDGSELWENTSVSCNSDAAVYSGDVYFFDSSQSGVQLTRINGGDGTVDWREGFNAGNRLGLPAVSSDVIFYLAQSNAEARAVRVADGSLKWNTSASFSTSTFVNVGPVVTGDGQVVMTDDNSGEIESFDEETGSSNWTYTAAEEDGIFALSAASSKVFITNADFFPASFNIEAIE